MLEGMHQNDGLLASRNIDVRDREGNVSVMAVVLPGLLRAATPANMAPAEMFRTANRPGLHPRVFSRAQHLDLPVQLVAMAVVEAIRCASSICY